MKVLFAACIFFFVIVISPAVAQTSAVYENTVLIEDVTWRGSVLVRGAVVVSSQATLRIEPGTVVRFASIDGQELPNLLVQGRLHAVGSTERPILLTSNRKNPERGGGWGGVVFLSTEKRNVLENCGIEYAETGVDLRFSTLTLKGVSIVQSKTALLSNDSVVQMSGGTITDSETGIEINNSEFDCKETTIATCRRGFVSSKSAIALAALKIVNNLHSGLEVDECRIRIAGGEFSGNALGASIKGGEGQIAMSRFVRNSQTALQLSGAHIKIQRCLFAENNQDALRVEDGQVLLLNNVFSSNGGFDLFNAGREVVAARQNWWGVTDQALIRQKIHDVLRDKNAGAVQIYPWLHEKPPLFQ